MGFIGYFVKLIHIPMYVSSRAFLLPRPKLTTPFHSNNILVYVSPSFLQLPRLHTNCEIQWWCIGCWVRITRFILFLYFGNHILVPIIYIPSAVNKELLKAKRYFRCKRGTANDYQPITDRNVSKVLQTPSQGGTLSPPEAVPRIVNSSASSCLEQWHVLAIVTRTASVFGANTASFLP